MADRSTDFYDVLIVGAGHGGASAAIALRHTNFSGKVAIIGDEPEFPYERPPLSKEYLSGEKAFDRILIRPAAFWTERHITMIRSERVTTVRPADHLVETASGLVVGYGILIWAAGGTPRRLTCDGRDLQGVHTVRTRADVDRIVVEMESTKRAVIIGGGYIGLEAAAVLNKLGKEVTVLEALDRVLARVAGEPLSRFYEAEHRAHGVVVQLSAKVAAITGQNGRLTGVLLESGETLPAEMVVVGIGIIPTVQPLLDAGADGSNGVLVDAQCKTTLPDIYAVGDCASHRSEFAQGKTIRLESVQNANDQANVVAKSIAGTPTEYNAVPWFWSNQYDLKLQTVGISTGFDQTIVRGDMASRKFSLVYLREGRVIALDCVNAVKDYVQGKALVSERRIVSPDRLADADVPLKLIGE